MAEITVATFNCENLFIRYNFNKSVSEKKKSEAVKNGFIIDRSMFTRVLPELRKLTADAIKGTGADIVCLQEVENLDTLKMFAIKYLKQYPYRYLIDGNDPRLIDVGVLSKFKIDSLVTHQYKKEPGKSRNVFSRDCLEVNLTVGKKPITLYVNHFKSMFDRTAKTPDESRKNTSEKRKAQVNAVMEIIKERFGKNPEKGNWAILGDFNDYYDSKSSLKALVNSNWAENVVKRLPVKEQWTHYWDTGKVVKNERYKQIDYIFLSKILAGTTVSKPVIVRGGLTTKADLYTGKRFTGVTASVVASDHCPVAIKIKF